MTERWETMFAGWGLAVGAGTHHANGTSNDPVDRHDDNPNDHEHYGDGRRAQGHFDCTGWAP